MRIPSQAYSITNTLNAPVAQRHVSEANTMSSSSEIDLYTCPPRDPVTRKLPLAYMAAIMTAAAKGAPFQSRCYTLNMATWLHENEMGCQWVWNGWDYRIDPASRPVAPAPFAVDDWVTIDTKWDYLAAANGFVTQITAISPYGDLTIRSRDGWPLAINPCHVRHATQAEVETVLAALKASVAKTLSRPKDPTFAANDWVMLNRADRPWPDVKQVKEISTIIVYTRDDASYLASELRHATQAEIDAHKVASGPVKMPAPFKVGDWVMFAPAGHYWPHAKRLTALTALYGSWTQLDLTFCCLLSNLRHATPEEIPPAPVVKRVPLTPEAFAGHSAIWLRFPHAGVVGHHLVTRIDHKGVYASFLYSYLEMMEERFAEWSPDRVNWYPCHRETTE